MPECAIFRSENSCFILFGGATNKETSTLVTTLEDGSIVYLGGRLCYNIPSIFTGKREVKLQGNALFDVVGSRSRPFLIETDLVRIEVLGTAFNVKSDELRPFELSVQRGRVKVTFKRIVRRCMFRRVKRLRSEKKGFI